MHPLARIFSPDSSQSSQPDISQQATISHPAITATAALLDKATRTTDASKKRAIKRIIVGAVALTLIILIYIVWNPPTPTPTASGSAVTQQNFSSASTTTNTNTSSSFSNTDDGSTIQVYITGAVKKPGVYTLPTDARVYQLLQAAGGPQPNANLVALNLAAKLTDGEEIYVTVIGEAPPTYMGGVPGPPNGTSSSSSSNSNLVNINTATVSELEQQLHVSSTTANNIINYRTQNGPYTSIDQLLNVISTSIFNRIKNMVTV
jgi:competence protein ComEA